MHVLSYWLDARIFGLDPHAARIHTLISTACVAILVYAALLSFGAGVGASVAGALLWLALPATVSIQENLSARQYVEGLGWALAACLALRHVVRSGRRRAPAALLWAAWGAAAMLSKEIYVPTVAAFALLYAGWHRRWLLAVSGPVLAILYLVYRHALLGPVEYPHTPITLEGYLHYLSVLPYTLSASRWGAALLLVLAALAIDAARRHGWSAGRSVLFLAVLLAGGLASVYPTAPAVAVAHETPGTWYRAVFIVSTLVVLAAAYLAGRHASPRLGLASLVIAVAIVLPGTARTRLYWRGRLHAAEDEGRFYLAHPDRLVFSEEDADWFLPGLDRLYGVGSPHAISKNRLTGADVRERLGRYAAIWRRTSAGWGEDP